MIENNEIKKWWEKEIVDKTKEEGKEEMKEEKIKGRNEEREKLGRKVGGVKYNYWGEKWNRGIK